ncbi:MAG: CAP domain-containing protein, partial [Bradyrhizobium sp.]|nr:CAP domain-containing protein [Bradyrhizobium sp.]
MKRLALALSIALLLAGCAAETPVVQAPTMYAD